VSPFNPFQAPRAGISKFRLLSLAGTAIYVIYVIGPEAFLPYCVCLGGFLSNLVVLLGQDASGLSFGIIPERIHEYYLLFILLPLSLKLCIY
jgi:hypothetical protein